MYSIYKKLIQLLPYTLFVRLRIFFYRIVQTFFGANSTIVCGVTLGEYSFVGAGAVITKDVKPYSLMVGNPARKVGWMSRSGIKLNFDNDNFAYCDLSKEKYLLKNDNVVLK